MTIRSHFLALVAATGAQAAGLNRTVLYVTQVPLPEETLGNTDHSISIIKMSVVSAMQSPLADPRTAGRGGALWIRYASGVRRNLTNAAGFGGPVDANFNATGFQGANSIAVAHPSMHWSGTKAVFSMIVGAPTTAADATVFHWQLYEITNFAQGQTPVIAAVSGQPTGYNNLYACYDTQDRIVFVSDAPRDLQTHLYPQLDEYLALPTNTGLWRLDRSQANELKHIVHTPSGAFSPFIDSYGRVIFVQWDHLSRDSFATYDRPTNAALTESWTQTFNGDGTFASEAPGAVFTLGTPANYAAFNNYPEPRNFDKTALNGTNLNGNAFNQFFPWECHEDGSNHEVQNHVGRHEFSAQVRPSFTDDANLITVNYARNSTTHLLQVVESPANRGTYFAIGAPEFGTHAAGQIFRYNGAPGVNPDTMALTYVTPVVGVPNPALGQTPLTTAVDLYRNPTPLSDGGLLVAHSPATQYDSNAGVDAQHPRSRYAFRLRPMNAPASGTTWAVDTTAGNAPTSPQNVSLSYYAGGQLVTYSSTGAADPTPLWELDPVEVLDRSAVKPAPLASPIAGVEQTVFDEEGVHAPTFQNYLRSRDLAVVINRNSTRRDAADRQQPFNLKVSWSATQTVGAPGKIYDIGWLQVLQSDAIRGYTLDGANPNALPIPGRRIMPVPLHRNLAEMPTVPDAPTGAVKLGNDGSWAAVVPARRAVTWNLLDGTGTASVIKERYWVNFAPGEVRTCAVCHGVNTQDQAGNLGVPVNKPEALRALLQFWKGNNPPGSVQHAAAAATVLKNAGTATLNVVRTGGSTGPASVGYSTGNGTAIAGIDYTAATGQLAWSDGDTAPKSIVVPISNAPVIGAGKSLTVSLSGAQYATLGGTTTATLTIDETPFNAWLFTQLGAAANGPAAAPDADADNDGLVNLLEYALGTAPGSAASALVPSVVLNGMHLEMSFTKAQTAGIAFRPEVSSDLHTWTPDVLDVTPPGSLAGFTVIRDTVDSTAENRRFIRLRVSMP